MAHAGWASGGGASSRLGSAWDSCAMCVDCDRAWASARCRPLDSSSRHRGDRDLEPPLHRGDRDLEPPRSTARIGTSRHSAPSSGSEALPLAKMCDFYGPALLVWCETRRNRDRVHVLLTRRVRSHGRHGVRGGCVECRSGRRDVHTVTGSRRREKHAKRASRGGRWPAIPITTPAGSHRPPKSEIPMLGRPAWRPGRGRLGSTHDGPLTVLGRTATPQPITHAITGTGQDHEKRD